MAAHRRSPDSVPNGNRLDPYARYRFAGAHQEGSSLWSAGSTPAEIRSEACFRFLARGKNRSSLGELVANLRELPCEVSSGSWTKRWRDIDALIREVP